MCHFLHSDSRRKRNYNQSYAMRSRKVSSIILTGCHHFCCSKSVWHKTCLGKSSDYFIIIDTQHQLSGRYLTCHLIITRLGHTPSEIITHGRSPILPNRSSIGARLVLSGCAGPRGGARATNSLVQTNLTLDC
jgi:hypothetical protein